MGVLPGLKTLSWCLVALLCLGLLPTWVLAQTYGGGLYGAGSYNVGEESAVAPSPSSPNQGRLLTPSLKPPTPEASLLASLQAQLEELQTQIRRLLGHSDSPASASATFTFTQALKLGSTGPAVQALQRKLNRLGYRVAASGPGSPGAETLYFGPATQQALARFQLAEKLIESLQAPVAGYLGPKTRARLNGR